MPMLTILMVLKVMLYQYVYYYCMVVLDKVFNLLFNEHNDVKISCLLNVLLWFCCKKSKCLKSNLHLFVFLYFQQRHIKTVYSSFWTQRTCRIKWFPFRIKRLTILLDATKPSTEQCFCWRVATDIHTKIYFEMEIMLLKVNRLRVF